ncbi:DUF1703-domain-containing protein [Rickenella mellea]|uniref:DUF1703-domain-containing protein n=1 Tax=Rickenella mellea TaxID=50990 RepID=A0A4Y7PR28_9AGAM|nr:DUF1703-domain-containing protein [Rickenella mellea]
MQASNSSSSVSEDGTAKLFHGRLTTASQRYIDARKYKESVIDKTSVVSAFLRTEAPGFHLVLRPRRCGKTFTLSILKAFMAYQNPSEAHTTHEYFQDTFIYEPQHQKLIDEHHMKYPVIDLDLKNIRGTTFEEMLGTFQTLIERQFTCHLDLMRGHGKELPHKHAAKFMRYLNGEFSQPRQLGVALVFLSEVLRDAYDHSVLVLIDEYDAPTSASIEHKYTTQVNVFFGIVFSELLKSNTAVRGCLMVGIARVAKSGWMSGLNHIEVFSMHAQDDAYATSFLFTRGEVDLLLEESVAKNGKREPLSIDTLQKHYNSYKAFRQTGGPVLLFNPWSIVQAITKNAVRNFWTDTGYDPMLERQLWKTSKAFRDNVTSLVARESVSLTIDEQLSIRDLDKITEPAIWGLLYYSGYLSVAEFSEDGGLPSKFQIPNEEVRSEWDKWIHRYLSTDMQIPERDLDPLIGAIFNGDPVVLQSSLTGFLGRNLSYFVAGGHKEKVYQALLFGLLFAKIGGAFYVQMEQEAGAGRADITITPRDITKIIGFIFELKRVTVYAKTAKNTRRKRKTDQKLISDLETSVNEAMEQLNTRNYRSHLPLHVEMVYEFGISFAGKKCRVKGRWLRRKDNSEWTEIPSPHGDGVVEHYSFGDEEDDGDEDIPTVSEGDVTMDTETDVEMHE